MVRTWYIEDSSDNQRTSTNPPQYVDLDKLKFETGVLYWKINVEDYENDQLMKQIRATRHYSYEDEIVISKALPNYEQLYKTFYQEHLHADEEIRLCMEGCGYLEMRDRSDKWLRFELVPGDLIVLPAGIYHRFTLDTKDSIRVKRYFAGDPVWTAWYRPADDHPARVEYLRQMALCS